jgi:hypothetical protein
MSDFYDRLLRGLLMFVASAALLAFAAALMPQSWHVTAGEAIGFRPFPVSPLTFYLARHLSLLYGFLGVFLWLIVLDWQRFRPLVQYFGIIVIACGILQLATDAMSVMPWWWTASESTRTIVGGCLVWWLERQGRPSVIP